MDDPNNDQVTLPTTTPVSTTDSQPKTDSVATQPQGDGGASNDSDTVTIKKSDYNNMISQRDSANSANNFLGVIAQERAIDDFLKQNADKFPDVTRDDLMHVGDPEQLADEAKRLTERLAAHAQKKLQDLTVADQPKLSPEDRAAELKKLAENPNADSFGRYVELQAQASKR